MLTVTEGLVLGGRYVVDRRIGVGGSGTVWRAHDRTLDRTVAVKVVPSGVAAARLAREARATAGIGVRNVVAVFDVGEQDGAHYLVMEYVDGVDLATLVAVTGPLPAAAVALVGHEVARGVGAVHAADLVHRDVTPSNVLVTIEGEVKLADLGIARRTDEDATRQLTEVGTVVGTVDYLAPEQVEGQEVTAASDVYGVGLLLHTAATGQPPFGDGSVAERLARRLATDPDGLTVDDPDLAAIVARAVQRDPTERFADGHALRSALAPLLPRDEHTLREDLARRAREAAAAPPEQQAEATRSVLGIAVHRRRVAGTEAIDAADGAAVDPDPTPPGRVTPPADDDGGASAPASAPAPAPRTRVIPVAKDASAAGDQQRRAGGTNRGRRGILLPLVATVIGVAAVVALAAGLLGEDPSAPNDAEEPAATPVTVAAVEAYDPLGDGDEHGDEVARLVDGDGSTAWDTEGYETVDLSGLKPGVGFTLDLGEEVEVGAVELDLVLDGVDATVVVTAERPDGDPTESGSVLGAVEGATGTARIEGDVTVSGRWVTVWFTSLAPDGERFRAEVSEVRVLRP